MKTDYGHKSYTTLSFFKNWAMLHSLALLLGVAVELFWGLSFFKYLVAFILVLNLLLILRIVQLIYKRLEGKKYDYQQIEALHSLYNYLQPGITLPKMRSYAGSPDFLLFILQQLEEQNPKVIVEAGSGISSMVISEWLLKHSPNTIHLAFDHEKKYADLTRKKIRNPNSRIIYSPLIQHDIEGAAYQWYSLEGVDIPSEIDLIIVDGPPMPIGKWARYPAVPLFEAYMKDSTVILLDDSDRIQEKEVAKRWQEEFGFKSDYFPLEKGGLLFKRD